jgi:hypothetical protein
MHGIENINERDFKDMCLIGLHAFPYFFADVPHVDRWVYITSDCFSENLPCSKLGPNKAA